MLYGTIEFLGLFLRMKPFRASQCTTLCVPPPGSRSCHCLVILPRWVPSHVKVELLSGLWTSNLFPFWASLCFEKLQYKDTLVMCFNPIRDRVLAIFYLHCLTFYMGLYAWTGSPFNTRKGSPPNGWLLTTPDKLFPVAMDELVFCSTQHLFSCMVS